MHETARSRRTHFGSFIVDGRGTILGFDEAMEELTRWRAIDVVGRDKNLAVASSEERDRLTARPLYDGQIPESQEMRHVRLTLHCRDDRSIEVEASLKPLEGPGRRSVVTVLRILSRSASQPSHPQSRLSDPLTGLNDRQAFGTRLNEEFAVAAAAARPLGLVLLDVDHLREINDRRGHHAGDVVLQRIAGILRVAIEDERRLARVGSDDFAILLPDGGRGEARQLAASLRSTVERHPFFEDGSGARGNEVTISLGAASFPADAGSAQELFERAGEALDEARSMGRNRVWCYLRRPRVPIQVPVFFDGAEPLLVGYTRDLSPSGVFVQTTENIDVGMRCALAFPLPGHDGRVHVVGRVVRTVFPDFSEESSDVRIPGLGIEFERFGGQSDRHAIDAFLHGHEDLTLRPETGPLSVAEP